MRLAWARLFGLADEVFAGSAGRVGVISASVVAGYQVQADLIAQRGVLAAPIHRSQGLARREAAVSRQLR